MILAELYIMQTGHRDEKIEISKVPDANELYRVTYIPRERKLPSYQFQLFRGQLSEYISDMLDLLRLDMYPYDSVQLSTKHMPPVVLSMMDLEEFSNRTMVWRTILTCMDANVKRTPDSE